MTKTFWSFGKPTNNWESHFCKSFPNSCDLVYFAKVRFNDNFIEYLLLFFKSWFIVFYLLQVGDYTYITYTYAVVKYIRCKFF